MKGVRACACDLRVVRKGKLFICLFICSNNFNIINILLLLLIILIMIIIIGFQINAKPTSLMQASTTLL
jgi:hypothetical protein